MIPLPSAIDNHQFHNAKHIMNIELGLIHQEKNGIQALKNLLDKINEEKLYKEWQNQDNHKHFQASDYIADDIIENI